MSEAPTLTERDFDEIVATPSPLFCPATAGIKKGDRFQTWAKVGGDMQLVSVIAASDPYRKGKRATYIEIYGYDIGRRAINIKKLLAAK